MIKRVILCVTCLLILSACDTGGSNTSGGTINNASGESYAPIDLDVITESTTGMILTGAIEHNTGEVNAYLVRLGNKLESYRNLEVETRNGYLLRFTVLGSLVDGTYPIDLTLDTLPNNQVAGGLLYLWSPDETEQFIHNPQGSLTVRFQGEDILGSFTMTVENLAGDSVSIVGQFISQETESAVRTN